VPILAGIDRAFQLAAFLDVGDDEDLGVSRQCEIADDMRLERAEVAAERDVLLGSDMRAAEKQYAVVRERPLDLLHGARRQRPTEVDARDFRAGRRGQAPHPDAHFSIVHGRVDYRHGVAGCRGSANGTPQV